ncbi:MAG TPA: DUF1178 family protein [Burkholderiales bacterium]|nr:DUF1178 family protein [Burkholderiales bacterium]
MVVYNLSCDNAHRFEGWFSSPEEFAAQAENGRLSCPVCGSASVARRPSAPYVNTGAHDSEPESRHDVVNADAMETMRRKLIEQLIRSTEDVGRRFPEEARRIHYKEAPSRSIRGQASHGEVDELREEGIEVYSIAGLPVPPDQVH